jgi:hypothetical protein
MSKLFFPIGHDAELAASFFYACLFFWNASM